MRGGLRKPAGMSLYLNYVKQPEKINNKTINMAVCKINYNIV